MAFRRLPFLIGAATAPSHGGGLPDELPFLLELDTRLGLVRQAVRKDVQQALTAAYTHGSLLGTAMDDTEIGRPYADDFLAFVADNVAPSSASNGSPDCLEIGAGRGYLLSRLKQRGWKALGLEPGPQNTEHWRRLGVDVHCDFFPSQLATGPFRVIVSYCVLEHLPDPVAMLRDIAAHLTPDGSVLLAVPNDEPDLRDGNLAMLVHEHFSYFTSRSLAAAVHAAGLDPLVVCPGYGGAMYCAARIQSTKHPRMVTERHGALADETELARDFKRKATVSRERLSASVRSAREKGRGLGFFCAARAVNFLQNRTGFRWFDDDPDLEARYYPPYLPPIESRDSLLARPVDELFVMSRTFGNRIERELVTAPSLVECNVHTMDDILPE